MKNRNAVIVPFAFTVFALAAIPFVAPVGAQDRPTGSMPDPKEAVFCKETYALCITAPCKRVPVVDAEGNVEVIAACECDVIRNTQGEPAWSMGPSSCEDRLPREVNGRMHLVSTYSNLYNTGENRVATCDRIEWAWCYGAPCVVDPDDPSKAVCNCPLAESRTNILGPCGGDLCDNGLWSAAWPSADCFANCFFYQQMTKNDRPTEPPAQTCSDEPVCDCADPRG